MSLGVEQLDDIGERITELLELKVPEGIIGKLSMLPQLLEVGKFPPRMQQRDAAVPGGRLARRRDRSRTSCRSSRAGPRTAARTSRCRW